MANPVNLHRSLCNPVTTDQVCLPVRYILPHDFSDNPISDPALIQQLSNVLESFDIIYAYNHNHLSVRKIQETFGTVNICDDLGFKWYHIRPSITSFPFQANAPKSVSYP